MNGGGLCIKWKMRWWGFEWRVAWSIEKTRDLFTCIGTAVGIPRREKYNFVLFFLKTKSVFFFCFLFGRLVRGQGISIWVVKIIRVWILVFQAQLLSFHRRLISGQIWIDCCTINSTVEQNFFDYGPFFRKEKKRNVFTFTGNRCLVPSSWMALWFSCTDSAQRQSRIFHVLPNLQQKNLILAEIRTHFPYG